MGEELLEIQMIIYLPIDPSTGLVSSARSGTAQSYYIGGSVIETVLGSDYLSYRTIRKHCCNN